MHWRGGEERGSDLKMAASPWRISRRILFRYRAIRCPQVGPIHVGPEILAAHRATCRALDGWAALGGNHSCASLPLADGYWRNANIGSKGNIPVLVKIGFQFHGQEFNET